MFKAFTDNLSSLIGNEKPASDTEPTSESGTDDAGANNTASGTGAQVDPKVDDVGGNTKGENSTAMNDASGEGTETVSQDIDSHTTGKVPPPRPKPPLTPAGSLCKQDTLPEGEADSAEPRNSSAGSAAGESAVSETEGDGEKKDRFDERLDDVAGKAKEWGSYLFSMTKSAGASVTAKAKELKKVVAENTILGDFVKEQDKFVSEKKEKARANEAAVPPWVGYNEEEQMKTQMLALSNDKRNFLRNPPTGVQFHFDYDTCYPVAMATLAEDERLQEMRFTLVPKLVTEHDFWRNFFYRVSLIKQSTQLTSLVKQSSSSTTNPDPVDQSSSEKAAKPSKQEKAAAASEASPSDAAETGIDVADTTAGNDEFISDAYNLEISDEDLMKEMQALRSSPGLDDPDWEQELQKELTEYEVVADSQDIDEAALEKEILKEMEKSSDDLK